MENNNKDTSSLQSRKWLLTINNPALYEMEHDTIKKILSEWKTIKYWCMCDEIGKEKTYHTHLFIYLHIPQELRIRSGGTERHSASN